MLAKFTKVLGLVLASCILSLTALSAQAQSFNRIVVFGDSLSDNGNLFKYAGLPEKPYFNGRFSNGAVWIEMLANSMQLDTTSSQQFADYAFGGAWAADSENGEGGLIPLSFERSLYFTDYPAHSIDEKNTLFVIWIGNNDYLQDGRLNENPAEVTDKTLNYISSHVEKLIDPIDGAGAKHFLILNLPDLGLTPKARQAAEKGHSEYTNHLTLLAKMYNEHLADWLKHMSAKHPDVEFISFNLADHFNDLVQHPEKYKIKDVTNPCFPDGFGKYEDQSRVTALSKGLAIKNNAVNLKTYPDLMQAYQARVTNQQSYEFCANTSDYLFWDYVHPTALAHELIAQFVVEELGKKS